VQALGEGDCVNFVKLYIGDYLRDTGTLTLAQHGAYSLMLLEFYATEKPLPTGRELHRLLRADSKAEKDAIDFVAAKYWQATDAGLTNPRAIKEIERAANQRAINQEIGKRGGRPKQTEHKTESVSESEPNRNPNHSQTPEEIQNPPTPRKRGSGAVHEFPPGFDAFWAAYPRKTAKPAAAKAFARLRPDGALQAVLLAAIARQSASAQWTKDRGEFIPHPATWLNGRRWEDGTETAAVDRFAGAL
jgi:uncharacterized protein YdaU (DUF1376 family)